MATKFSPEDLRFAGSLANINVADLEPEALKKYQKTIEEQIAALEQRYNEPNWFKVAAGFAKPQLGGFIASLGSAAEAMGENVEQQREQMLPIAQMKVAVEQANVLLGQKQKQYDIFKAWQASGKPMTGEIAAEIRKLGDTDIARAADKYWEQEKNRIGTGIEAERGARELPRIDASLQSFIDAALNPKADPKDIAAKNKQVQDLINTARPPQIEPDVWAGMSREAKDREIQAYASRQRELGMSTENGIREQAAKSPELLTLYGKIRELALGAGIKDITKMVDGKEVKLTGQQQMGELLNVFGGNNLMEVIARAVSEGAAGPKFLEDLDRRAIQLKAEPEARDAFQKLAKLLMQNQVSLRNSSMNPTDASARMQREGSPNLGNSQTALVSLVDLMAHTEQHTIDRYVHILQNRIPARQIDFDPEWRKKNNAYFDQQREIATSNPLVKMPSWYRPSGSAPTGTSSENAAPATPSTPPAASSTPAAPAQGQKPAAPARSNERVIGGKTYVRQADGSYKLKE